MTDDMRATMQAAQRSITEAEMLIEKGLKALSTALQTLQNVEQAQATDVSDSTPEAYIPRSRHRRLHKAGPAPKIDSDPELQAFIRARIDHMTYADIATEIATTFPKPRRVGRSTIHRWWSKNKNTQNILGTHSG